jgi:hypothetical protein
MRYHHVLLQTVVSVSVLQKKIVDIPRTKEMGTNLVHTTISTTTNCDHESLFAVHPKVY